MRERIAAGLERRVGALCERDGEDLLVHQVGRSMLPGGGVEPGETRAEALVRGVKAETGLGATVGACSW